MAKKTLLLLLLLALSIPVASGLSNPGRAELSTLFLDLVFRANRGLIKGGVFLWFEKRMTMTIHWHFVNVAATTALHASEPAVEPVAAVVLTPEMARAQIDTSVAH